MISRRRKSNILFLCFQAMAVAIICLGSLINFHQYKIWGKPLIPNFVCYKRDIEKYSKTISYSKFTGNNFQFHKDFPAGDFDIPSNTFSSISGQAAFITFDFSGPAPVSNLLSSSGLRGPPIS